MYFLIKGVCLSLKGGNKMKQECWEYIEDHGPLEPGQVFMSSAGNLPYQKVFHVLQVPQNSFDDNLEMWIKSTLEQVLQTVNSNEAGVLRSIAIPLLGGGTRRILKNLIEVCNFDMRFILIHLLLKRDV